MDSGKPATIMSNMTKMMRFKWGLEYTVNKTENVENSELHRCHSG